MHILMGVLEASGHVSQNKLLLLLSISSSIMHPFENLGKASVVHF